MSRIRLDDAGELLGQANELRYKRSEAGMEEHIDRVTSNRDRFNATYHNYDTLEGFNREAYHRDKQLFKSLEEEVDRAQGERLAQRNLGPAMNGVQLLQHNLRESISPIPTSSIKHDFNRAVKDARFDIVGAALQAVLNLASAGDLEILERDHEGVKFAVVKGRNYERATDESISAKRRMEIASKMLEEVLTGFDYKLENGEEQVATFQLSHHQISRLAEKALQFGFFDKMHRAQDQQIGAESEPFELTAKEAEIEARLNDKKPLETLKTAMDVVRDARDKPNTL